MNSNKIVELKNIIKRLHEGEAVETVRRDFIANFAGITADELATAEQLLVAEGIPLREVKRLCDVHAALFQAAQSPVNERAASVNPELDVLPPGHPISQIRLENSMLNGILDRLSNMIDDDETSIVEIAVELRKLLAIHSHYGKKEAIMPILYRYGVTGPSQVMWTIDDEIKFDTRELNKKISNADIDELRDDLFSLLERMREMTVKEERIFLPIAMRYLTAEDWLRLYADFREYGSAFIEAVPWDEGDQFIREREADERVSSVDGALTFPTGALTLDQLQAIFKLMPIDITFIDANERLTFFSNEGNTFARPRTALGNSIYDCHPPKLIPTIKNMINGFKNHLRDSHEIFKVVKGKPTVVKYVAVRDSAGNYLGTVEFIQNCSEIVEKFDARRR